MNFEKSFMDFSLEEQESEFAQRMASEAIGFLNSQFGIFLLQTLRDNRNQALLQLARVSAADQQTILTLQAEARAFEQFGSTILGIIQRSQEISMLGEQDIQGASAQQPHPEDADQADVHPAFQKFMEEIGEIQDGLPF